MLKSTNQCLLLLPSVNMLILVPNFNAPILTALTREAITLSTTVSRLAVVSVVTILLGGVAHGTSICTPTNGVRTLILVPWEQRGAQLTLPPSIILMILLHALALTEALPQTLHLQSPLTSPPMFLH